ncbi:unnamed protein product [Bursaphelenchus xylophilus]|uniref:(pine wood nematode) hypothetical protein n=1 Tax=Bursaphelenchus xylophilus TaxID=6326 RepID=A0A1I7RWY2_BURXY|nr:unnamed protein product [Bursaphelenchus xylophilus]CAG9121197.1 unnamed protein product [Bursaphelenchus xylophilus]
MRLHEVLSIVTVILAIVNGQGNSVIDGNKCDINIKKVGVNPSRTSLLVLDNQNQVFQFDLASRKLVSKQQLDLVFPNAPRNVDLIVSNQNTLSLLDSRTFYSYSQAETGLYSASGTSNLHSRVVFYPDSAIILNSDDVILINGGVYAHYNLAENSPKILRNRDIEYPHLPEGNFTALPFDDQPDQRDLFVFYGQKMAEYNLNEKLRKNERNFEEIFSC